MFDFLDRDRNNWELLRDKLDKGVLFLQNNTSAHKSHAITCRMQTISDLGFEQPEQSSVQLSLFNKKKL